MPTQPNQGTIVSSARVWSLPGVPSFTGGQSGELIVCQGQMPACDPATGAAGSTILCGGVEFESALSVPLDLSTTQTILFVMRSLLVGGAGAVQVKPFLRNSATPSKVYLPIANLDNQTTHTHVCDLTTLDATTLKNVTHVGFAFAGDVTAVGATQFPQTPSMLPIFALYSDEKPGNIAAGNAINYCVSEWNAATDAVKLFNVIQSDGSPLSADVTTTVAAGAVAVTLAPKVNPAATHYAVYRFGDFPDGYGRLLCLLPVGVGAFAAGADVAKGSAPYFACPANPFIAVKVGSPLAVGSIQIVDNTPASFLLLANLYQSGRQAPPNYIREIASWQGRMWLLTNGQSDNRRRSELYGSWLLSADNNAGLYFSRSVSPTDPSAPVKGFYTHLGTEDGDRALRLLTIEDRMIALFERKAPYLILGSDPSNIEVKAFKGEANAVLGLVARRAALLSGYNVIYLTANGLVSWSPLARVYGPPPPPVPISEGVRNLVAPHTGYLPAFKPPAVAQAALWEHGGRFFLAFPASPADTAPTVILRLDLSGGGLNATEAKLDSMWTRYLPLFAPCGGADVPGADNNDGHYVASASGMLYLATIASGDTSASGGPVSPIAFSLVTRAYGSERGALFALKRPYRLDVDLENGDPANTVSLLFGMAGQTTNWNANYLLAAAARDQFTTRPGFVRGENVTVSLSGSAVNRLAIGGVRVRMSVGSERSKLL